MTSAGQIASGTVTVAAAVDTGAVAAVGAVVVAPGNASWDTATKPEVVREAARLFGDSGMADARTPTPDEPSWDIDVHSYETHARVQYFIERLTGPVREEFLHWLARSGRYEPMIRAKLKAAGLPEDMTYLALIESGYDPHAYSRAAAVGMWQLMTSTAKGTGLRVDWWVDERRDPVRSTDAAIKFLGWLNEQFGSLYLAAAAYNGGPGRIERGLERYAGSMDGASGDDAFFVLAEKDYLRSETKDYVPKLIATALVAKNPSRYGLTATYLPALEYDTVRVAALTPLSAVAKAVGVPLQAIGELNPHILRGVTPPRDSFVVRVPPGTAEGFAAALAALPQRERTAFTRLVTRRGESGASLARRAGVSVHHLEWYNPGLRVSKRGRIAPGQPVLVPTAGVVAAALDVPDPSIERYGVGLRGRMTTHVVRRGESLGVIAKRYHTTVTDLTRLNHLRRSLIVPGQEILIRRANHGPSGRSSRRSSRVGN